jgi:hypothetical protein
MRTSKLCLIVVVAVTCVLAQNGKPSKSIRFDSTDVIGYLENPTPVYILDTDDPKAEGIYLDRSFKESLRENIDKEVLALQVKK